MVNVTLEEEGGDIIEDIERIQQALRGLSSIDSQTELEHLLDSL